MMAVSGILHVWHQDVAEYFWN